jgi:raffinose/stachyose/melibiose transport system substrate-binding protein
MKHTRLTAALLGTTLLAGAASAQDVTLTIESWRNDDLAIWQETIIPAFEAAHPGIKLTFAPSAPTEYNAALNSKLDAGSAGDLITCRPFDASLELFNKGKLADLTDLKAMANFSDVARSGWSTDDGAQTFCVPMASVIHGFIYNKAAFDELGLQPPKTEAEFFAVLDKIKADGTYVPMAMGTNDQWEAATMGYQNIGPNYWKGEEGRLALIKGEQKLTDDAWVAPFREIAKWKDYLGDGFEAQTYPDSQNLFTLGRAAIYPAGSWEIAPFRAQIADSFEMGAFPPPVANAGDDCYISDHVDIAVGMNAATAHPEEAKAFLEWVGTPEFAKLYGNALPGFFPLQNEAVAIEDPLAKEFLSWRETCKSTIRSTYQILSRGTPNLENETWNAAANVVRGTETPEAAAQRLQDGLASWYEPQKSN